MGYYESNLKDLSVYTNSIKNSEGLSREDERKLSERIKQGDENAVNELVEANLKYVVTIAKKYAWTGVPVYDLISEGNMGLIRAAKKFDASFGTKFITYARYWIEQAIEEHIDESGHNTEMTHMDDYIFNDESNDETINYDFEEEICDIQSRDNAIKDLLSCLNKREYRVLQSYFGLNNNKPMTLEEISVEIGLSQERVRQIKDESIMKIQFNAMSDDSYAEYKELY